MAEIDATMTAQEFFDWQVFAALHPFPADLIDRHGAVLATILANANRDAKMVAPFEPHEFVHIRPQRATEHLDSQAAGPSIADQILMSMGR